MGKVRDAVSEDGDVSGLFWTSAVVAPERIDGLEVLMHALEKSLAASSTAPRAAREFLREVLATQKLDGFGDVTELLTTELVANVVDHVGCDITLRVYSRVGLVRVEVDDTSATGPIVRHQDPLTSRGNGMLLVEGLATRWGVQERVSGKTVWFELDALTATDEIHGTDDV